MWGSLFFFKIKTYEKDVTRKKDIGSDVSENYLYPSTKLKEILRECQLG